MMTMFMASTTCLFFFQIPYARMCWSDADIDMHLPKAHVVELLKDVPGPTTEMYWH